MGNENQNLHNPQIRNQNSNSYYQNQNANEYSQNYQNNINKALTNPPIVNQNKPLNQNNSQIPQNQFEMIENPKKTFNFKIIK